MSRRASRLTVVNLAAGQTQRKKPWQHDKWMSWKGFHWRHIMRLQITVTANQHIKNSQPLGGRSSVAGHRTPCKQGNPQRPTTGCGRGRRRLPASFCKTAGRGLNKGKSWRIAHTQNLLYPQLASLSAPANDLPATMCLQVRPNTLPQLLSLQRWCGQTLPPWQMRRLTTRRVDGVDSESCGNDLVVQPQNPRSLLQGGHLPVVITPGL